MFLPQLGQGILFILFFSLGAGFHFVFKIASAFFVNEKTKWKRAIKILFQIGIGIFFVACFFWVAVETNYGVIRIYEIVACFLGAITSNKLFSKFLAKIGLKCYDFFVKLRNKFRIWTKREKKHLPEWLFCLPW